MPIQFLIFEIIVLVFSAIIHEYMHGWMADRLGDPTAKLAGRLTLNPLPHLDLFGSFLLPLLLVLSNIGLVFGWAKPVPFNPYN
jgi:Zn-dependent protease